MVLHKGDRVCLSGVPSNARIWTTGETAPSWVFESDRTFEVIEVSSQRDDGSYRIVIGNHRKGNGPITRGVTGAIYVYM